MRPLEILIPILLALINATREELYSGREGTGRFQIQMEQLHGITRPLYPAVHPVMSMKLPCGNWSGNGWVI